ncbi:peptidase M75 [Rhodobacterales bacterium 56_14_T64]|nr:peptidase M75 [Rhodobacterales bacterium 56_14_T64]
MRSIAFALSLTLAPLHAQADMIDDILNQQILPGMDELAFTSDLLAEAAKSDCHPDSGSLRGAYSDAFDAWISVSHLRFGPTETNNRAFALAFWPDSRSKIPKVLAKIIQDDAPELDQPSQFATYSIAARGFHAMEFLLYDGGISLAGSPDTRCRLIRAIATDINNTSHAINFEWQDSYAAQLRTPGDRYQTEAEVKQELYKALNTGLQVTADMRLGRPLGTFDHPRPKRAEARRSGRSLHHVTLSLQALQPLALALSGDDAELVEEFENGFSKALNTAAQLDDPVFAGVADPSSRFRVESLQQQINDLRTIADTKLGPSLGVDPGFNSLDGD